MRVHDLVPEAVWRRRYEHIRDFERLLADEGTTIVKFFLHISKDEQRARLQERIDDPEKRWKFDAARPRGAQALGRLPAGLRGRAARRRRPTTPRGTSSPPTATGTANWAVLNVLVGTLREMNPRYPPPPEDVEGTLIP